MLFDAIRAVNPAAGGKSELGSIEVSDRVDAGSGERLELNVDEGA